MSGSTSQSYFIFDQPQYSIARKLYFAINAENNLEFDLFEPVKEEQKEAEGTE